MAISAAAIAAIAKLAPMAVSAGQTALARRRAKKAQEMTPTQVDPRQVIAEERLNRLAKSLETGTASRSDQEAALKLQRQTLINSLRRGSGGAGVAASSRIAAQIGETLRKIGQDTRKMDLAVKDRAGALRDMSSQRALELGILGQSKQEASAAQLSKAGQQNLAASLFYLNKGQDEDLKGLDALTKLFEESRKKQIEEEDFDEPLLDDEVADRVDAMDMEQGFQVTGQPTDN